MATVLFAAAPLLAQNATLTGTVSDEQTGETLPGANVVVLKSGAAGTTLGDASDLNGTYRVTGIEPGTYIVTVSYIGYEKKEFLSIVLNAGEARTLDIALSPTGLFVDAISISASRRPEKTLEAPASITVLSASDIRGEVAPSSSAILRNTTGIDMASTGIDRKEIVLRGFNNAFSGAAYIMTDYRQAAVPSLAVNLHSVMPNMLIDLDKVEVVRGPGSALYGPGVDAGVIHYITKGPFSNPGTTVSFSGGERSMFAGAFRHAGTASENVGYKITAQFARADDWALDPSNAEDAAQLMGDVRTRNYDYRKMNVNGLLQYRLSDETTLSLNGGYSLLDATVLSGIGTVQADGFGYSYGQVRLQSGRFFTQAYYNKNRAGDSFVYGTGQAVVDNGGQFNGQAQYDFDFADGDQQFIVGADVDIVTPDTEGTIYGRNEQEDQIQEYGAYAQSLSRLSSKLDLTLALRGDYNNIVEEFQLAPRVALVVKPSAGHSFRGTYNRAFSSPGNNSLFLDIVAGQSGPITVRGRGARSGFSWVRNPAFAGFAGTDLVARSLNPATLGAAQPVGLPLDATYGSVYAGLAAIPVPVLKSMLPAPLNMLPDAQVAGLVALLAPTATQVQGFSRGLLGIPSLTGGDTKFVTDLADIEPLKQTITQTVEVGYKGLIENRFLLAVDGYLTNKKNFVGPLLLETPLVFVPTLAADLQAALGPAIANNAILAGALGQAGVSPEAAAQLIVGLAQSQLPSAQTPVALVAAAENDLGAGQVPELMLSYRNFGNVTFYGVDVTMQYFASDRLKFFGNASIVSDDFFDNEELDETNTDLSVALNAPTFKIKGGFNYDESRGISLGASARFIKGFPVRSGPFSGEVEDYFLLDLNAGYDLSNVYDGLRFDLAVQNILDNAHREFVGAPLIGRLAMARLTVNLQ